MPARNLDAPDASTDNGVQLLPGVSWASTSEQCPKAPGDRQGAHHKHAPAGARAHRVPACRVWKSVAHPRDGAPSNAPILLLQIGFRAVALARADNYLDFCFGEYLSVNDHLLLGFRFS